MRLLLLIGFTFTVGCIFGGSNNAPAPDAGPQTTSDAAHDSAMPTDSGVGADVASPLDEGVPAVDASVDTGDTCERSEETEQTCDDRADNDCDGLPDCLDPDCAESPDSCGEDCTNDQDDDGDGLIDCADVDCRGIDDCGNRIFVTRALFAPSDLGDDRDFLCRDRARNNNLGGEWIALLSYGTTNARDRVELTGVIHNLRNAVVAPAEDIWEFGADDVVQVNASGGSVSVDDGFVWTGTTQDGTASGFDCEGWTTDVADSAATVGYHRGIDFEWIDREEIGCDERHHIYCVEVR